MNKNWIGLIQAGKLLAFSALAGVLISGCSGSSSSSSSGAPPAAVKISGTAAAGAPVVGYVSVNDSSGKTQPVKEGIAIEANGKYTVDVTGLTPPYAFLATGTVGGKTVRLYSAATSADEGKTINITPFTDLIIRNIAGGAVDTYLATSSNMAKLTNAELDAKRVALTTLLAPALTAMGLDSSIDLLRATFNADNSGLDRFMDAVKVDTTVSTAVTITNIMDAASSLIVNTTASTTTIATSGTLGLTNLTATATPLDGIVAGFKAVSDLYATSIPSATNQTLIDTFHADFLNDGENHAVQMTDMTSSQSMIGFKINNVIIDSINLAATPQTAQIRFTPVNAAGVPLNTESVDGSQKGNLVKDVASGRWQFYGNRRIVRLRVGTLAIKGACNPLSTTCYVVANNGLNLKTGLKFEIDKRIATPAGLGYAIVTGNGLPATGVRLDVQLNYTTFKISTLTPNVVDLSLPFNAVTNPDRCTEYVLCNWNHWLMNDTEIAAVTANSVYTIKLYSNATPAVLMATYTETVPVAPALNTALATKAFPSLTGMVNLSGTGGTLTPSWSVPTGLKAQWMHVYVWQNAVAPSTTQYHNSASQQLNGVASGTATLVLGTTTSVGSSGNWTGGNYSIAATDQYGGQVQTFYQ